MKTPDEIRKGLKYCSRGDCERGCPYWDNDGIGCANNLCADALAYMQQMDAQRDEFLKKVDEVSKLCMRFLQK